MLYTYYVCIFAQNDMIGRVQYVKHILMILRSQRTQCNMEVVGKGAPAATQFAETRISQRGNALGDDDQSLDVG